MRIFWKKLKNRLSVGGSTTEHPFASGGWCSVFASFALLHVFFTSNSVDFVDRGRKIIPCPKAQGTLTTPLFLWF